MRKRRAVKRDVLPDPIYNSKVVTKLVNTIMIGGKKGTAQKILYEAFDIIKEQTGKDPMEVYTEAMKNIKPALEVKADRGFALASSWLIESAKKRGGKSFIDKLTNELIDASNGAGSACKKREDTHKMAEANKAFAHYRY